MAPITTEYTAVTSWRKSGHTNGTNVSTTVPTGTKRKTIIVVAIHLNNVDTCLTYIGFFKVKAIGITKLNKDVKPSSCFAKHYDTQTP